MPISTDRSVVEDGSDLVVQVVMERIGEPAWGGCPYSSLILPVDHRSVGSASEHPDRVGAELPGFRDPAFGIVLGAHIGVGTPVHNHCLVDRGDSRIGHLPNRPICQPFWGLVASGQRPVAAVASVETD